MTSVCLQPNRARHHLAQREKELGHAMYHAHSLTEGDHHALSFQPDRLILMVSEALWFLETLHALFLTLAQMGDTHVAMHLLCTAIVQPALMHWRRLCFLIHALLHQLRRHVDPEYFLVEGDPVHTSQELLLSRALEQRLREKVEHFTPILADVMTTVSQILATAEKSNWSTKNGMEDAVPRKVSDVLAHLSAGGEWGCEDNISRYMSSFSSETKEGDLAEVDDYTKSALHHNDRLQRCNLYFLFFGSDTTSLY